MKNMRSKFLGLAIVGLLAVGIYSCDTSTKRSVSSTDSMSMATTAVVSESTQGVIKIQRTITPCKHDSVTFEGEDYIVDLDDYFKDSAAAVAEANFFSARFGCGDDHSQIDNSGTAISMCALTSLYDKVASHTSCATSYITGLKILFGLDMTNKKIVLFYQPVCMCDPNNVGSYAVNFDQGILKYDGNNFVTIEPSDTATYLSSFRKNMMVDKYGTDSFQHLTMNGNDNEWENDSRSMIFSFQELFKLYHESYNTEMNGQRYVQNLYIYNGAVNYRRRGAIYSVRKKWLPKYTLFLKADNGQALSVNEAANMAHLCPPDCITLRYDTE